MADELPSDLQITPPSDLQAVDPNSIWRLKAQDLNTKMGLDPAKPEHQLQIAANYEAARKLYGPAGEQATALPNKQSNPAEAGAAAAYGPAEAAAQGAETAEFGAQHPYENRALAAYQGSGIPGAAEGIGRLLPGQVGQNAFLANQNIMQTPVKEDFGTEAGSFLAGSARFGNPVLAGAVGGLSEYGQGGTPGQAITQGAIDSAIAWALGGKGNTLLRGMLNRALSGVVSDAAATFGSKVLAPVLPQVAGQMTSNVNNGRPIMENVYKALALSAGGGALHGMAPEGQSAPGVENQPPVQTAPVETKAPENVTPTPAPAPTPAPMPAPATPPRIARMIQPNILHENTGTEGPGGFGTTSKGPVPANPPFKDVAAQIQPVPESSPLLDPRRVQTQEIRSGLTPERRQANADAIGQVQNKYLAAGGVERRGIAPAPVPIAEPTKDATFETPEGMAGTPVPDKATPAEQKVGTPTQVQTPAEEAKEAAKPPAERTPEQVTAAVTRAVPKEDVPKDTFGAYTKKWLEKLWSDEGGGFDVKRAHDLVLNAGRTTKDIMGGMAVKAGNSIGEFFGGNLGRSTHVVRAMDIIKLADDTSHLGGFRRAAAYKPYIDATNQMIQSGRAKDVYRLVDEIEAHQAPSDPKFGNLGALWHEDGVAVKRNAIRENIPGAQYWNEDQMGRSAGMIDKNGKKPYEFGYKAPEGSGPGGLAPIGHVIKSRSLAGGHEDFVNVLAAKGMAPMHENPLVTAIVKRVDAMKYVHFSRMAKGAVRTGLIRKLDFGDQQMPNEQALRDKLFQPPQRKWSATNEGGLLDKLNNQDTPLKTRLALFRQGIKNGTVQELPPASPDELQEHYQSEVDYPYEHVIEVGKNKGQTETRAKTEFTEPGTGEYHPTYEAGRVPEKHGLVDDALAQADRPRYVADKAVANIFNKGMEPSPVDPQNPFVKAIDSTNRAIITTKLGLQGAHYMNFSQSVSGLRLGRAIQSLTHGQLMETAKALRQAIPGTGLAEAVHEGGAAKEAFGNPNTPMESRVQLAKTAGGIPETPDIFKGQAEKTNFKNPASIIRAAKRMLFEKVGENARRGAQFMGLQDVLNDASRKGLSPTDPEVIAKAKKVVEAVNYSFSNLKDSREFQSKAVQLALREALAFPHWTTNPFKLIGRAAGDVPELLKTTNLSPAQQAVAGHLLAAALAGGVMNTVSTGKLPQSAEDFFHPHVFGLGRWTLPAGPMAPVIALAYAGGDVVKWAEDRFAPVPSMARQYYEGRDFQGKKTRGKSLFEPNEGTAKMAAKEVLPTAIQPTLGLTPPEPPEQQALEAVGFNKRQVPKKR